MRCSLRDMTTVTTTDKTTKGLIARCPPSVADMLPATDIFKSLNGVMIGYALLVFAPRWQYTRTVVRTLVFLYSVLYAVLVVSRWSSAPLPEGAGFYSIDAVIALFSDGEVVLAGWTHYIAFDLFVSSWIVEDAHYEGIPHMFVVWMVPVTLMAGPVGAALYMALKAVWTTARGSSLPEVKRD